MCDEPIKSLRRPIPELRLEWDNNDEGSANGIAERVRSLSKFPDPLFSRNKSTRVHKCSAVCTVIVQF